METDTTAMRVNGEYELRTTEKSASSHVGACTGECGRGLSTQKPLMDAKSEQNRTWYDAPPHSPKFTQKHLQRTIPTAALYNQVVLSLVPVPLLCSS